MKIIFPRNFQNLKAIFNSQFSQHFRRAFFAAAFFVFLSISTSAAVTVDRVSSDRDSSLTGLSSMTWSHTVGTGTERALYVGVSSATTLLPNSVLPSLLSVSGVTYNNIPMTRVGSVQSPGLLNGALTSKSYVDIYRLVNPPSGSHSVVVTFSTLGLVPLDFFVNQAVGGAISYNGVDQITPNGFFASNSATTNAPSVVVSSGTNQDLIMDVLASSPNAGEFTAGAGQTLRWEGNFPVSLIPPFDLGAGSTKAGAASVTMNWTLGNSNRWALGGIAVRAASNPPSVLTVNTNADNEADGCGVGLCTLREAINDANNTPQPDTINFAPSVTGQITLTGGQSGGQLIASSDITINGPGARNLAVNGNNTDRVFLIATPLLGGDITVNISGLTITNGNATAVLGGLVGDGGGILNGALLGILGGTSTLNLTEVNVNRNRATTLGGGIATRLNARTNITRSLVSNNTSNALPVPLSDVGGGGISNVGTCVTTISNSTVTNNESLALGGGILNAVGTVNLINNTISHNRSTLEGGGVASVAGVLGILGTVNLRNTIIAQNNDLLATNILGRDVFGILGSFTSQGNNIIGSNFGAQANFTANVQVGVTPTPDVNGNIIGGVSAGNALVDPLLGLLQNNGGPTNTRLPFAGSPAIDRGNNCVTNNSCPSNNPPAALTVEQRGTGFPRVLNATIDIGATEGVGVVTPIIVNSLADNQADGCGIAIGTCTLREAIDAANGTTVADTIIFAPEITGTPGTITLTGGRQLIASTDMTITGPGARTITVNGNDASRVFLIATPILGGDITVGISGLTITNGNATPVLNGLAGDGGGILNGALLGIVGGTSTLNLTEVTVDNNEATTLGGGVATRLNAVTNIYRSTISNNFSNAVPLVGGGDVGGGGVSNIGSTTNIINSTISDNESLAAGGGILNAAGVVNLTNDTITRNSSTVVGGGLVSVVGAITPILGVANVRNTIIADNEGVLSTNLITSDVLGVLGSINSLGNNLIGSNFGAEANLTANVQVGVTPTPDVNGNIVGGVSVGNTVVDPLLGALQNNGGPTNTRLPLAGSPALNRGNNCVVTNTCSTPLPFALTIEQRGVGFPRLRDSAVEIGAVEVFFAPTAAETTIAGRVLSNNGSVKGIARALVTLTDSNGTVRTALTNPFGVYRFTGVEAQRTYILQVRHKQYIFAPQIVTPLEDLLELNLIGTPSGGGISF